MGTLEVSRTFGTKKRYGVVSLPLFFFYAILIRVKDDNGRFTPDLLLFEQRDYSFEV